MLCVETDVQMIAPIMKEGDYLVVEDSNLDGHDNAVFPGYLSLAHRPPASPLLLLLNSRFFPFAQLSLLSIRQSPDGAMGSTPSMHVDARPMMMPDGGRVRMTQF